MIIRFWRKPYPSANWCPRLEVCYTKNGAVKYWKNHHNDLIGQHAAYAGEFELTTTEFNRFKKLLESRYKGVEK